MTYGYIQYNDSGLVQIDGTYPNLRLIASGTILTGYIGTYPGTTGEAILAIGIYSTDKFVTGRLDEHGANTFLIRTEDNSNFSVPYKIFAKTSSIGPGTMGMRLFDASSNCVFDSNYDYFGIKYIQNISTVLPAQPSSDYIADGAVAINHYVGENAYVLLGPLQGITGQYVNDYDNYDQEVYYTYQIAAIKHTNYSTVYIKRTDGYGFYRYGANPVWTNSFNARLMIGT
jgi:hypothetical protein